MRLLACLIVAPQRGYDEPAILSYEISSFCPTSADGLHLTYAEDNPKRRENSGQKASAVSTSDPITQSGQVLEIGNPEKWR